jgi:hypothetical protein
LLNCFSFFMNEIIFIKKATNKSNILFVVVMFI